MYIESPTLLAEPPTWNHERMVKWNKCALARRPIAKCGRIRPTDELSPIAMHNLGKGSKQRVCDVVQEGRVGVEVGKSLCLKLETFAAKVGVYKVKHGALGGIGRVDGRKCSKDRLRA
jgi:hypothetical protein